MRGLSTFIRDDAGELSCMRLLCLLVVAAVLAIWCYANLRGSQYVPLGMGEAGIITAAVGGKAAQSYVEYGRCMPGEEGQP